MSAGPSIRWDAFEAPVGRIYAAAGERGLCRLTWGSASDADFERDLTRHHPGSRIERDAGGLATIERDLRDYFGGRLREFDVSIDLSGASDFERAVFEAARRVPYGATATYSELARRVGRPAAARAVGNALRRNPLPLLVPCHRIVRADGSPGGYGGPQGTPDKLRLLRLERGSQTTTPNTARRTPDAEGDGKVEY